MSTQLTSDRLLAACADQSQDAAIVYDADLMPLGEHGTPVNPAIYPGGKYQRDKRWASPEAETPTDVVVIDNVASQANRLEAALDATAEHTGVPRLVLSFDIDELAHLPAHIPKSLSSLRWPHRNADSYLRDSLRDGDAFVRTSLGKRLTEASAHEAAALVAWFPQAVIYGFWQSHLGRNRNQSKHARAWVSEIVGWAPATGDEESQTRTLGVKGDPVNIGDVGRVDFDDTDLLKGWDLHPGEKATEKAKMSSVGHGQVPFKAGEEALAAVSFRRITQRATLSFPQLRRVRLGDGFSPAQDAAARALTAALGVHAHFCAFGQPFALRSGTDLEVAESSLRLGGTGIEVGDGDTTPQDTAALLADTLEHARACGVPVDGWGTDPLVLTPNKALVSAIRATWPDLDNPEAS